MPGPRPAWTREEAIGFLNNNPNWREIMRTSTNAQPAHELGTAQLKRYASALWSAEKRGEWLKDRAALRGHRVSENKPKNRARKPGMEDWAPPVNIPRGLEVQKHNGGYVAIRRTGSQAAVVRFLARMALTRDKGPRQVAINIYGFRKGQFAQLMWKGGFNARKLLEAAGYHRTRAGYWAKSKGGLGIQDYLLEVLMATQRYPQPWGRIALYEVWAWQHSIVAKAVPTSSIIPPRVRFLAQRRGR